MPGFQRVAVIGNAGGGKSALCMKLSRAYNLPFFPIDIIQWKPGWKPAPADEVKQKHDHILQTGRWFIDGWGSFDLIEERFRLADTIILVDHPLIVHYGWALKRQAACLFAPRPDGPPGCPMPPMTWPLMKMIWKVHFKLRPRLLDLVNGYRTDKQVFHIRSPRQLRRFIQNYCDG